MKFKNKVVIVTGSTSGIGRAIAIKFSENGATVIVSGRREVEGKKLENEIIQNGGKCLFVPADVSKEDDIKNLVNQTIHKFGKLDIAVNSAGISGDLFPVTEYPLDVWNQVIAINLTGVFLSMKYEIPEIIKQGGGVVLNVSSALGLRGKELVSAYSSSKHGVIGLTKCAALEYGKYGIRVNAACFGGIETEMDQEFYKKSDNPEQLKKERLKSYALGRMGNVNEVANTSIWLCSDEASFITGAAIPIDGGKTSK
ncbi:MAG TPA: glucose 1-dehydrogenase [Leptospiraceae bacterium]|nr:glucose 1-dehydrogenase [Leptospiraceae bacterium]HMW05020.1 glucose 1-dehydrogenase [Leptospiraceae bacterium]HMX31464.1 glucose 1-dehydrogenase [Leptospiraceae bacterium]HMY33574.1 glucose 1-dehydrogenase [Leptospiraceae bacterium]HMZ62573.1 glucose 1-dehydrogenase [Leptospiraceae bacterium]